MTIRHLKIFLQVADTGKMSAAAKNLYLTQPTVSQAIRELEEHYQTLLFERRAKKLYITDAGRELYTCAKQVLAQFEALEERMSFANRRDRLRIGATVSVGGSILSPFIRDFCARFPELEVFCCIDNTQEIEKRLLTADLDVGIIEGFVKSPDILTVPLIEDPLVLACGSGHPLASKKVLRKEDLEGQEFVIREKGSGTRELLERFLLAHNIRIRVAFEAHTPDAIKNALRFNGCLTLISGRLLEQELRSGEFTAFSHGSAEWNRYFRLAYHKYKEPGIYVPALMEMLSDGSRKGALSELISGRLQD